MSQPPRRPIFGDDIAHELVAAVAHDLRNPLAAIVTNLEFARRVAGSDPDLAEAIADSGMACELLRRLAANLEVLSDRAPRKPAETCQVRDLASEAVAAMRAPAAHAGLVLESAAPPEGRVVVERGLVMLALENMMANAVQHAPRGSHVRLDVSVSSDATRFVVRDAGPVVPEALRQLAVSPEGHTARGRTRESRYGRGLGLLCAAEAARRIGGRLEVGADGGGSALSLEVPSIVSAG